MTTVCVDKFFGGLRLAGMPGRTGAAAKIREAIMAAGASQSLGNRQVARVSETWDHSVG